MKEDDEHVTTVLCGKFPIEESNEKRQRCAHLHIDNSDSKSNKQKQLNNSQQIQFKSATSDDESTRKKYITNKRRTTKATENGRGK